MSMYVCLSVHVFERVSVCVCACVCLYMHLSVNVFVHVYVYVCTCVRLQVRLSPHVIDFQYTFAFSLQTKLYKKKKCCLSYERKGANVLIIYNSKLVFFSPSPLKLVKEKNQFSPLKKHKKEKNCICPLQSIEKSLMWLSPLISYLP